MSPEMLERLQAEQSRQTSSLAAILRTVARWGGIDPGESVLHGGPVDVTSAPVSSDPAMGWQDGLPSVLKQQSNWRPYAELPERALSGDAPQERTSIERQSWSDLDGQSTQLGRVPHPPAADRNRESLPFARLQDIQRDSVPDTPNVSSRPQPEFAIPTARLTTQLADHSSQVHVAPAAKAGSEAVPKVNRSAEWTASNVQSIEAPLADRRMLPGSVTDWPLGGVEQRRPPAGFEQQAQVEAARADWHDLANSADQSPPRPSVPGSVSELFADSALEDAMADALERAVREAGIDLS